MKQLSIPTYFPPVISFENGYFNLVQRILDEGTFAPCRNGATVGVVGAELQFSVADGNMPILEARTYPYKGVLGEFAALVRGPKHLEDFIKWGCPYWAQWADKDLKLHLDYGNAWFDFNGVNQIEWLFKTLRADPYNRRMIVTSWRPDNVINGSLSLPCCHYTYQFVFRDDHLHLVWIQRSADTMLGIPADAVLATALLVSVARIVGYKPGTITMQFADTHIYEEHIEAAEGLLEFYKQNRQFAVGGPKYFYEPSWQKAEANGIDLTDLEKFQEFLPDDFLVSTRPYGPKVDFLLKS